MSTAGVISAATPIVQPSGSQTFTVTNSSWTVPAGVYYIDPDGVGGGGGGGVGSFASTVGAGGASGSRSAPGRTPVTPGETLNIIVGTGGAKATVSGVRAASGLDSEIRRGGTVLWLAKGGQGALNSTGGVASTTGTIGTATSGQNGANGTNQSSSGYGGTAPAPFSGAGGINSAAGGPMAGSAPGGGGGGGDNGLGTSNSGAGARGEVRLTW